MNIGLTLDFGKDRFAERVQVVDGHMVFLHDFSGHLIVPDGIADDARFRPGRNWCRGTPDQPGSGLLQSGHQLTEILFIIL